LAKVPGAVKRIGHVGVRHFRKECAWPRACHAAPGRGRNARRGNRGTVCQAPGAALNWRGMAERQLHLFDPARPLLERFGESFFKAAPAAPGIYIMSGECDRVLYIGQSGNLRQRLASYKNARPDRAPRKVVRLVHAVRTIVWEECPSPEAALTREAQLLRVHRPRFNVQNTYPAGYVFISVGRTPEGILLGMATSVARAGRSHGAFKTGAARGLGALLRLLWATCHQPRCSHDFPRRLICPRPPREFLLPATACVPGPNLDKLEDGISAFLAGESDGLIRSLAEALPPTPDTPNFLGALFTADLKELAEFYRTGPERNHGLRARHGLGSGVIPKELLDELLVRRPRAKETLAACRANNPPGRAADGILAIDRPICDNAASTGAFPARTP
jgi:predicted GIY-YIG superfamily endonuclease